MPPNKAMVTTVGLPLLIVNGKFQNLYSMSVEDLETFIPFLVKCSIDRAGALVINGVPEWWSSTVQYKFPLKKPKGLSIVGYRRHLSSIVCRCYWYHDAQYLLPFCAEVARRPESVYLQNNDDNTTSIFVVSNTIHVMKFCNENKDYDLPTRKRTKVYKRCLLNATQKKAPITDIYLCENCDAEFSSHTDMQKHEKECSASSARKNESSDDSSSDIEVLEHIKRDHDPRSGKTRFFDYLQLHPTNGPNSKTPRNNSQCNFSDQKIIGDSYLIKNRNVEFSSTFGRKILQFNKRRSSKTVNPTIMEFVESHCGQNSRNIRETREPIDFRVTCKKPKENTWVHQYCFNKKQRRKRYKTLKTGLDENSRKLLRKCKTLKIVLPKLQLDYLTQRKQSVNGNCSNREENSEMSE